MDWPCRIEGCFVRWNSCRRSIQQPVNYVRLEQNQQEKDILLSPCTVMFTIFQRLKNCRAFIKSIRLNIGVSLRYNTNDWLRLHQRELQKTSKLDPKQLGSRAAQLPHPVRAKGSISDCGCAFGCWLQVLLRMLPNGVECGGCRLGEGQHPISSCQGGAAQSLP